MKNTINFQQVPKLRKLVIILSATILMSCSKETINIDYQTNNERHKKVNVTPLWRVEARYFYDGAIGTFDDLAVKDPSIVYAGGKWHLFFTGRDKCSGGLWRMGYTTAYQIQNLQYQPHFYMSSLNGGGYFCAPQAFYFSAKNKWYLIYQSGLGATYSTNTAVQYYWSWTEGQPMGFNDGIDFWVISDGTYVYCFYSAQDGTRTIKRRRTTVQNFPTGWSGPTVVATETFEAPHVYKNKVDGKYYMMVEDLYRYFELWTATNLGGTWTKLAEKWASRENMQFLADRWTDQVSHGEIIRSGFNELMEIDNIDRCQILIQGVVNGNYGDYGCIPYDLGIIHNF